ncbi:MAG: hypothetical protein NWT08_12790 [Akkermansiaceae bacterium]|jgi:hypothetical protein|nr:hypothetical protein [Akkermansiaceae bacterium]MDP4647425.1 hypothetical protein [Akkermansiaceae bacterium]MDP4721244.1 hypothetical protein [Akkermansiaceae bacterium]MDP4781570.1 hypothetical protein [Akkermansiaceae bacterium]MDP4848031.1 hypothetical protein [Akkermansiaceae bacterium]
MSQRKTKLAGKSPGNRKKLRPAKAGGFLASVSKRSHEKTNRRLPRKGGKSVWASIAIEEIPEEDAAAGFLTQTIRVLLALVLLPICWVTTWTFLKQFSHATVEQGFWQSSQFWYFTVGSLVMLGWFWSKIGQPAFLYCYVFGHELTHAAFVKCFGGKVLDINWGSQGGYVTTNKTNWVIALSPYFVPFWSSVVVVFYLGAKFFFEVTPLGNLVFYGAMGATWSFHLAWTLWMIPRDQPDLKDNGTFLSLVLIYFGNLVVLIALLCLAAPAPLESLREFGYSWVGTAMTWGSDALRWVEDFAGNPGW